MENLKGRYIKVLNKCLGGLDTLYKVGDYLKILEDNERGNCVVVELAGILSIRGDSSRILNKDIELMPKGFIPKYILPEKWCVKITKDNIDKAKQLKNKELGFPFNYDYSIGGYYTPFKNSIGCYGLINVASELKEISWERFGIYVLKESF